MSGAINKIPVLLRFPNLTEASSGTYITNQIQLLTSNRFGNAGLVYEIFKIYVEVAQTTIEDMVAASDFLRWNIYTGVPKTAIDTINGSRMLMSDGNMITAFASGAGIQFTKFMYEYDMQNKDGSGVLVAAETLNLGIISGSLAAGGSVHAAVVGRYRMVNLQQWTAIFTAQQGGG